MTYPTVLLHLDDDARAEVRNEQAVRFALRLGSQVCGLSCHRPVPVGAGVGASMGGLADTLTLELEIAQKRAVEREQRFRALCDRLRLPAFETEIDEAHEAGRALLRRAALADLVIVGQPDPADDEAARRRRAIDDVVLHNPRPTLLLPYAGRFDDFGKIVLVAWDASRGAARAVADALPLLKRASAVHLVQFDRRSGDDGWIDQAPVQGVAKWLARHGIEAQASVQFAPADIGNALLSCAADVGADLLVMGSWGHSRITERLLGGATRTVMESMTVPVLTSR